jgi:hypothetical protein
LFTKTQVLKAKKLLKNNEVQLNFLLNKKAYFKVKNYEVIINLKDKKVTCSCNYFLLKRKLCSHILAALLYLFKEVNIIYEFLKKNK